ncbi:TetR/AcrR family transcriptional regulator [Brevibacillus sp. SYP-B805]|uniref:TetR/AcrR family transcriptional regulator n=1 Tax=Brevibacillus sp. SYP-B805 TaxID=1578199 RepID=UPI0013EDEB9F|nr:TetR/AcrR family transcriptional regulator [Brevibacillus sp. SYP-B805]NGQ95925.1 TetR/AcrR family transcriptional regulator [Brevibacillus sp. SYP-B805]
MPQEHSPTFQAMIAATEELVREKGCRRTTLQDIMDRTGLSKGAIYHYVKSKDELYGLILKTKMEEANRRFFQAAEAGGKALLPPLQTISDGLVRILDKKDVSNQIFVYLLSQQELPAIKQMLQDLYAQAVEMAVNWIRTGQREGVISAGLDARRAAELFVLITYGFRMRSMIEPASTDFGLDAFQELMQQMLQGQ